jgi:hypothetical protein
MSKTENEESTKSGGRRSTMPFTVTECTVNTNSITITFSDTVLSGPTNLNGGDNPANYTIYDPAAGFSVLTKPDATWKVNLTGKTVTITLPNGIAFNPGDYVLVGISNVASTSNPTIAMAHVSLVRKVPGETQVGRVTRDVEDAISYPILTEEIGYRPSPVGIPTGGGSGIFGSGGGGGLGQVAAKAVSEVLGWKPSTTDPKGFVGALTQAFTLTDVEGHTESTWNPRTYAVQTDLGGGITGAQASLYMRAKNALDSTLPLLDGLYPLDPEADPEYVKALREMARSQMTEIIKELGTVGLPSILRIDTYFEILLGQNPAQITPPASVQFDPDEITGTLGELRDTYGIAFVGNKFNNSVEDEQDITNFRVISDYMTSLMQSWIANRQFFFVKPKQQAFFGTQLVLISRQFTTIAETVNEVRFALDSVFIGPNERQTLLLKFKDGDLAPMFLEDVLCEIEKFAGDEGPRLLRDGGKISVTNNILPVVRSLQHLVKQAHAPLNIDKLPDGFKTARVRNSLDDLQDQLRELILLIDQIKQEPPVPEDKLTIDRVTQPQDDGTGHRHFSIFGNGFTQDAVVNIYSTVTSPVIPAVDFFSSQRIDGSITQDDWDHLASGSHDVVVKIIGQTETLQNAFQKPSAAGSGSGPNNTAQSGEPTSAPNPPARKRGWAVEFGVPVGSPTSGHPAPQGVHQDDLAASITKLQQRHEELVVMVEAVMEKITVFETTVKNKKNK